MLRIVWKSKQRSCQLVYAGTGVKKRPEIQKLNAAHLHLSSRHIARLGFLKSFRRIKYGMANLLFDVFSYRYLLHKDGAAIILLGQRFGERTISRGCYITGHDVLRIWQGTIYSNEAISKEEFRWPRLIGTRDQNTGSCTTEGMWWVKVN